MIQTFVRYQMLLCYDIKPKHGYTFFKRRSRFCSKDMPNFCNRRFHYLGFFPCKGASIFYVDSQGGRGLSQISTLLNSLI